MDIIDLLLNNLNINEEEKENLRHRIYNLILVRLVTDLSHIWTPQEIQTINDYLGNPQNGQKIQIALTKPECRDMLSLILSEVIGDILNNKKIIPPTKKEEIKAVLISNIVEARFG